MKVYIIGAGDIDVAKMALEMSLPDNAVLVKVERMEDIPFHDRVQSSSSQVLIQELHKITARPICEMPFIDTKKYKGHERPYKYHK